LFSDSCFYFKSVRFGQAGAFKPTTLNPINCDRHSIFSSGIHILLVGDKGTLVRFFTQPSACENRRASINRPPK
jgi:hypothetical protein